MQLRFNYVGGAYNRIGLGLYDNVSGKMILFGVTGSGPNGVTLFYMSGLSTYSSTIAYQPLYGMFPEWFRVSFDGTTYTFSYSFDNSQWYVMSTAAAASYLTATHIGMGMESYNTFNVLGVSCLNYSVP
jgi:hypothetical protein